jgi:hypothetical protein
MKQRISYPVAHVWIALLAIIALGMILWLGAPVLYMDDWTVLGLLQKVRSGTAGFRDFWATYNEHRIFLPRLFYVAAYETRGLDPRPLMWLSWLVMATCVVIACRQFFLRADDGVAARRKSAYAIAFAAVLFAIVQYENWLWGFELQIFLTQAFVLLASVILGIGSFRFSTKVFWVGVCAVGASCSNGQGILLWVCATVGLLVVARTWQWRIAVSGVYLAGFLFFVWQYGIDPGRLRQGPGFNWVLQRPSDFARAFFALVGSPLTYWAGSRRLLFAPAVGFLVSICCLLQSVLVLRAGRLRSAAPFVVLCSFGFLFCGLVAFGRGIHGYNEWFMTSRYTTHALLIPAGMLGLDWVLSCRAGETDTRRWHLFRGALFLLMPILVVAGTWQAIAWAAEDSSARQFTSQLIPLVSEIDPAVDGMPTGPFYPLCPVDNSKVIEWGIGPALANGLLNQEPVKRSTISVTHFEMQCDSKSRGTEYLGHRIYAKQLSGLVAVPRECQPNALLVRKKEGIVIAAALHRTSPVNTDPNIYRWSIPVTSTLESTDFREGDFALYGWLNGHTLWEIQTK